MTPLRDRNVIPDEPTLRCLLADSFPAYTEFIARIGIEPLSLEPQWNFYQDVKAWLCKIVHKKETISWLSVEEGCFKVTTYFQKKHQENAEKLPVNQKLIHEFIQTGLTRKNPFFTVEVTKIDQIKDVLTIMGFKKTTL